MIWGGQGGYWGGVAVERPSSLICSRQRRRILNGFLNVLGTSADDLLQAPPHAEPHAKLDPVHFPRPPRLHCTTADICKSSNSPKVLRAAC